MCVTDGQNYDSQDRASIAASHGKNLTKIFGFATIYMSSLQFDTIYD